MQVSLGRTASDVIGREARAYSNAIREDNKTNIAMDLASLKRWKDCPGHCISHTKNATGLQDETTT